MQQLSLVRCGGVVLMTSLLVSCTVTSEYVGSTFFDNKNCTGTPRMIQYSDDTSKAEPECVAGKNGDSWTEEARIQDVYAHAMKQFGGASFVLRSTVDECSKGYQISTSSIKAGAYASSEECYSYDTSKGRVSVRVQIHSNSTATYQKFTGSSCKTPEPDTAVVMKAKSQCAGGWKWQVYDSTGQKWKESSSSMLQADLALKVMSGLLLLQAITQALW